MKFSIKDFFSKFQRIWSHLLKEFLTENFIFLCNVPSSWDNSCLIVTENKFVVWNYSFSGPKSIYLLEFSNNNSRIKYEICSHLKYYNRINRHRSGVFIINREYIWHVSIVFSAEIEHVNAGWNTLFSYLNLSVFQKRI